jgi:hypothetical protein
MSQHSKHFDRLNEPHTSTGVAILKIPNMQAVEINPHNSFRINMESKDMESRENNLMNITQHSQDSFVKRDEIAGSR